MIRSIGGRLFAGSIIGCLIILVPAGAALYASVRAWLWSEFDGGLAARARSLASLVEEEDAEFEVDIDERSMPEYSRPDRPDYFEIWRADGTTLARSRWVAEAGLERPAGLPDGVWARSVVLPDGRAGRAVGVTAAPRRETQSPHGTGPILIVVAQETAGLERMLARLRWLLAGLGLVTSGLLAGVLARVVRKGLRPLNHLAGQLEQVGGNDLAVRVQLPNPPAELRPVLNRTNELLSRLEAAFDRERAFSAEVAHELRTPLSGLRSMLEVSLSRRREAEDYRNTLDGCLQINSHLQAMVDNLLAIARLERGQASLQKRMVCLADLLSECWEAVRARAEERSVECVLEGPSGVVVESDPEKLRQVLGIILDNAVTYVDEGGRIELCVRADPKAARILVRNTGSALASEEAPLVFERFWRGSTARTEAGTHCGLGLALAKRIMTLLGGTISAESRRGEWFAIELSLPVGAAADAPLVSTVT